MFDQVSAIAEGRIVELQAAPKDSFLATAAAMLPCFLTDELDAKDRESDNPSRIHGLAALLSLVHKIKDTLAKKVKLDQIQQLRVFNWCIPEDKKQEVQEAISKVTDACATAASAVLTTPAKKRTRDTEAAASSSKAPKKDAAAAAAFNLFAAKA